METAKEFATQAYTKYFRLAIQLVVLAGVSYLGYQGTTSYLVKQKVLREEHMQVACPTLFSVARTPRDTLLVMRSESVCIDYVMKTLR